MYLCKIKRKNVGPVVECNNTREYNDACGCLRPNGNYSVISASDLSSGLHPRTKIHWKLKTQTYSICDR